MNEQRTATQTKWTEYLRSRTGSYQFRCIRYAAVADLLIRNHLGDDDLIVDVGAGWCEFDHYLRTSLGWRGRYLPVDGSIDGTDLEDWQPEFNAAFFVALEVLEHLERPYELAFQMQRLCTKGVVLTTPNPATVDVLAMDKTHRTPISLQDFQAWGYHAHIDSLFGKPADSIIASFFRR